MVVHIYCTFLYEIVLCKRLWIKNSVTSYFGEPLLKKIRILLNAKGTCERIFKYFNTNGDEKSLISIIIWTTNHPPPSIFYPHI